MRICQPYCRGKVHSFTTLLFAALDTLALKPWILITDGLLNTLRIAPGTTITRGGRGREGKGGRKGKDHVERRRLEWVEEEVV